MLERLERLTAAGRVMADRARRSGALLIWRLQARSVRRTVVQDGRAEDSGVSSSAGQGVHVHDEDGGSALASRDDVDPDRGLELLPRAVDSARRVGRLGFDRTPLPDLDPLGARSVPAAAGRYDSIDLGAVRDRLVELEREIGAGVPGVRLKLAYRAELDCWRIFRCDGTDVIFAMPRSNVTVRAFGSSGDARHSVTATVSDPDPGLLWDERNVSLFLRRGRAAAELAARLPDAPPHPAGSFPLVIDYALAKGLAHEAFGHASEADGFRSSVLAKDGRFRRGERVGPEYVSIVDEPVEGDHAWQPFSSNGLPRRRAVIVDHGRLHEALSDPWSARAGGVPLTGAARAETFRNAPLPRMTNIRIEVDRPLPAPGDFEDYTPGDVRDLLEGAGVFARHPRVAYLSGYSGGQVNPATGDFVFNCRAIYGLDGSGATLFRPAIFSGSMFGALKSIREAFGSLRLDALGYCGKWGQSVPSSGGSHYFVVLEPHDDVRLGGS